MNNFFDDFNRHYFADLEAKQALVDRTVQLRDPHSKYLHRATYLGGIDECHTCGDESFGISTSLAACGANRPGTPPRHGQKRQWFHGSFDVVNLVDGKPQGQRCKKCFGVAT